MRKPFIIVILGPPGSGKGTQAKLLVKKFDLEYFGAGESLRARQKEGDFTAKKLIKTMGQGIWIPSFVITKLWAQKLREFKQKKNFRGLVTDGSPRRILEAQMFDEAMAWYEWQKRVKVVFLNISQRESINRLTKRRQCKKCKRLIPWLGQFKKLKRCDKCGGRLVVRHDDKPQAISMRLKEFKEKTMPVINYYKKQKKLVEINGEQSIEDVFRDILKAVQ